MPCMYDDSEERARQKREERALEAQEARKVRSEVELLTRLLCSACTALGAKTSKIPELSAWWAKHSKADADRIKREHRLAAKQLKDAQAHMKAVEKEKKQIDRRKVSK